MKPYDTPFKKALLTTLCLLVGNLMLGFMVAAFIVPHDIIMGGVTGIGILLNRLIPSLDISITVLVLNVLLLILGWIVLGRKFALTTVASSLLYPLFLGIMERIPGIERVTSDPLLASIYAGLLMGLSLGLMIRVGSSSGGLDIVCLVLHKWFHWPVAVLIYLTDFLVMGLMALFSSPEQILLGILVALIEMVVLDQTLLLGKPQTQLYIISSEYEKIREALLNDLKAGVTLSHIQTGRLKKDQKAILCVIPPRKLYQATEMIQKIDPEAFITISQIKEVHGRGFTAERTDLPGLEE